MSSPRSRLPERVASRPAIITAKVREADLSIGLPEWVVPSPVISIKQISQKFAPGLPSQGLMPFQINNYDKSQKNKHS